MPSPKSNPVDRAAERAVDAFRNRGGTMRSIDALEAGVHPRVLNRLRDAGTIEQVSRGVYRLAGIEWTADPDLLAVAVRVPRGVICLTSALVVHELTTQVPRSVEVALPPGGWTPVIRRPPIRVFRFSDASMSEGVESRVVDGVTLRIFSAEKSIADCFKFRNKIGSDIAVEALRMYRSRREQDLDAILRFARVDRVEGVMRPYVEAVFG